MRGLVVELLDGDEIRMNLDPELGFSKLERTTDENVSHLLSKNGIITVVAIISPPKSFRQYARNMIREFVEVWVNCSVETCKKGLYRRGNRRNF